MRGEETGADCRGKDQTWRTHFANIEDILNFPTCLYVTHHVYVENNVALCHWRNMLLWYECCLNVCNLNFFHFFLLEWNWEFNNSKILCFLRFSSLSLSLGLLEGEVRLCRYGLRKSLKTRAFVWSWDFRKVFLIKQNRNRSVAKLFLTK